MKLMNFCKKCCAIFIFRVYNTNSKGDFMRNYISSAPIYQHFMNRIDASRDALVEAGIENTGDFWETVIEAPQNRLWVRDFVIPRIYEGDDGLEKVLNELDAEKNIIVAATRTQFLFNILRSLPDSLENMKWGVTEGLYDPTQNVKSFDETIDYRHLH